MTLKKYSCKLHQRRLLRGERINKERTFHQELEKAFTWLQFDESQQTTFCSVYGEFPPLRNAIKRKM